MSTPFAAGEAVYVDRARRVTFIRYATPHTAIIQIGHDTHLVDVATLSREEA